MVHAMFEKVNTYTVTLAWRLALVCLVFALAAASATQGHEGGLGAAGAADYVKALAVGRNRDFEDRLELLRKAAGAGNLQAQELLPVLLLGGASALQMDGEGGHRTCEALLWFDKAADQGSRLGQTFRGMMGASELAFARKRCLPDTD